MEHSYDAWPAVHVAHCLNVTFRYGIRERIACTPQASRHIVFEFLAPHPMGRVVQSIEEFKDVGKVLAGGLSKRFCC